VLKKPPYMGEQTPLSRKYNRWLFQELNSTMPYGRASIALMLKQDQMISSTYVPKHEDSHPNALVKLQSPIHHRDQTP
jgi:hypothetical protein